MVSTANYSIKNTSNDWGINCEPTSSKSTLPGLHKIFEYIKLISNGPLEVTTMDPSGISRVRTCGKIAKPAAGGHLILNSGGGVDLRIIPGKTKSVSFENLANNRYKAIFKNNDGNNILSMSFYSNESIDSATQLLVSKEGRLRTFNNIDKGIEDIWRNMTDIHHFYPMLRQLGINKIDAFRAVPDDLAWPVDICSIDIMSKNIQENKKHFMAFIGNNAAVQIYSGPICKISEIKKDNIIFIHGITSEKNPAIIKIAREGIGQAWVVNKNSIDGFVTSLEIFDHNENHVAQFYSLRKEGQKQSEDWEKLMHSLPKIV